MEGSIRKRGKASWELTIDLGRDAQGQRERKFITVRGTKAEAQRKLREILSTHDKGLPVENPKVTVAEYLERWLRDYVIPRDRPATVQDYEYKIRKHIIPALGKILLIKLQPADVYRMEADMLRKGYSASTVSHAHVILQAALKHAMKWGLIYHNVATVVDRPRKPKPEPVIPDVVSVDRLLTMVEDSPYWALFYFIAFTACRRGEALGLRWREVDLDKGVVSILHTTQWIKGKGIIDQPPKTAKSRRAIALDPETVAVLRLHRAKQLEEKLRLGTAYEANDLVFAGPTGKSLSPSTVSHAFRTLADKAGLNSVRLHDLRHFHATMLLQAKTHPKIVQERLGHSTIAITLDIYSHVIPGMQEEAAESFAAIMRAAKQAKLLVR